ncbi:RNA polymerase sigma factor [Tumebacillus flagellatus]|uniref:RNA polymerase sigma factor n=1 Tax=Tumebacillus flagellatus TaxID=1157490 RepID=A0A074LUR3_9BACL|nr:RNA polymerase sigma factor [Tumebacillus flagellatus]KEO84659.1 hypothetical protein EL26_03840 [Tumebacillus flagellatus]
MKPADEQAFYEIYNAYYQDVYRYVFHTVKQRADVEDLVQEIFLQAYRSFMKFRGESGYRTWLFSIAHNHLNSMWRKLFRRKQIHEQYERDVRSELTEDDGEWKRMLLQQELREALLQIPDHYRDVVVLRYLHDFHVGDAAVILGMTEAKVRMLTHRAILKLRDVWEREGGGELYGRANPIA